MATIETIVNERMEKLKLKLLTTSFMMKRVVRSIEEKHGNLLPIPLYYLKEKVDIKLYSYYVILIEQLVINEKLENYLDLFIFSYDSSSFDILDTLKELKEIILNKESLIVDDLTDYILSKIE